jgi:hypothetical protein
MRSPGPACPTHGSRSGLPGPFRLYAPWERNVRDGRRKVARYRSR